MRSPQFPLLRACLLHHGLRITPEATTTGHTPAAERIRHALLGTHPIIAFHEPLCYDFQDITIAAPGADHNTAIIHLTHTCNDCPLRHTTGDDFDCKEHGLVCSTVKCVVVIWANELIITVPSASRPRQALAGLRSKIAVEHGRHAL